MKYSPVMTAFLAMTMSASQAAQEAMARIHASNPETTSVAGTPQQPTTPAEGKAVSKEEVQGDASILKPTATPANIPTVFPGAEVGKPLEVPEVPPVTVFQQAPSLGTNVQQNTAAASIDTPGPQRKMTVAELRAAADKMEKEETAAQEAKLREQSGPGTTFYTRHPNSTFIAQLYGIDGKPLVGQTYICQFHGDSYYTEEPSLIAQLQSVSDQPASPIFTKKNGVAAPYVDQVAFMEVRRRAGDVVEQIARAGQRA